MRCQICAKLSLKTFCKECQTLLVPNPQKRVIQDLEVISFYEYEEMEKLLKFKYEKFGDKILGELAKITFKEFFKNYQYEKRVSVIPVDDTPESFSHTAILARACKGKNTHLKFNTLRAKSSVKYAGKDLGFRKANPKNFRVLKEIKNDVILVDDIVTTGTTLLEAKSVLEKKGVNVLFALTLASS